jgi:hypothetical protein
MTAIPTSSIAEHEPREITANDFSHAVTANRKAKRSYSILHCQDFHRTASDSNLTPVRNIPTYKNR